MSVVTEKAGRRLLLVDNDPYFLQEWGAALEHVGYDVSTAGSREAVASFFESGWVHAMVVDVRLLDDDDPGDKSGIALALDPRYRTVPKIILTGFEDWDDSRKTMGNADERFARIIYVIKREGLDRLLEALDELLSGNVTADEPVVEWSDALSITAVLGWLVPHPSRADLAELSEELASVLRQVSEGSDSVRIERLIAQRPGRVTLAANSIDRQGTHTTVVIVSHPERLERELVASANHAGHGHHANGVHSLKRSGSSVHYAAASFDLPDTDLEKLTTFDRFYHPASTERVTTTIEQLFGVTLAPWYQGGRSRQEASPARLIRDLSPSDAPGEQPPLTLEQMEALASQLLNENLGVMDVTADEVVFHSAPDATPRKMVNPIPYLTTAQIRPEGRLVYGTTAGLLRGDQVLTDGSGRSWLLDLEHSGPGPLLRDFVGLESVIRNSFVRERDISQRFVLEEALAGTTSLDEEPALQNLKGDVRKAGEAIQAVRQSAAAVLGPDVHNYLAALFYASVAQLSALQPTRRYTSGHLLAYVQHLFAAALLCPRLSPLPIAALSGLWIDPESKEVWVEGQRKAPGRQEKDVLLLLYENAEQLCTRTQILRDALQSDYADAKDSEGSRLDTIMSRLRRDIAVDNASDVERRYIETIIGEGYVLHLRPVAGR